MFPTRNGTWVLFIPAYIDHGSTSGQSMEMGYSQHSKEETDNITLIFYHFKMKQKIVHVDQWLCK